MVLNMIFFFFSSRRRHTRCSRDWSSDVCSSDLDGVLEKISFVSEDGEYIPGLLWLPRRQQPAPTVLIVDDRGKQAVATSGLVEPLLKAGYAVLAVDLRGRGETLGRVSAGHNLNFRLLANQVLFGQPLAGR